MPHDGPNLSSRLADLTAPTALRGYLDAAGRHVTKAGWIVCRGSERLCSSGVVACPLGQATPIEDCLSCRFLETVEDERDAAYSCATDAPAPRP